MSPSSVTTTSPSSPRLTFKEVVTSFTEEANWQGGQQCLGARPGSEYANATSIPSNECRTNPTMGIQIHKHNTKGVACENPAYSGLPRSLTHDREHCMQPGGGMEGKSPWAQRDQRERGKKKDVAASAVEPKPPASAPSNSSPTETTALAATHHREWSSAAIEELDPSTVPSGEDMSCIASQHLSTILDSGMTSNLIMNKLYFWSYNTEDKVKVKTANHGTLLTSGRGDCIAELMLNNRVQRIRFTQCLHAPGALVNLLSVGHMVDKGWAIHYLPSPSRCHLVYHGEYLGSVPMVGKLV
ncbi:hypothetical protein CY34DRAFT_100215, partial [Suillus luteus UH-Slu-Lm8-n1]